jgi:hypothetical protein
VKVNFEYSLSEVTYFPVHSSPTFTRSSVFRRLLLIILNILLLSKSKLKYVLFIFSDNKGTHEYLVTHMLRTSL